MADLIESGLATCGTPNERIVGGIEVQENSWPWIVRLDVNGENLCGGTIIDDHWVCKNIRS